MVNVFKGIAAAGASYRADSEHAWASGDCPGCGPVQLGRVAFVEEPDRVEWLRCTSCGSGLVNNQGILSPESPPLAVPLGLPEAEAEAWQEVRACLSVGAYTAAVMICRKLLMHLAVTHGLAAKNDKGRAPSYAECVQHLQDEGVITSRMRRWVDRVKDVGNEANHELEPVAEQRALDVGRFTEQLLKLAYEMDAVMAESAPE